MKIVHFTTDEKFINGAMSTFELAFPGQNKLYLLKPKSNPKVKYIDSKYITKEFIYNDKIFLDYISLSQTADWVILHGMNQTWAKVMLSVDTTHIINVIWGAEIYGNPFMYKKNTLGEDTRKLKSFNSKFSFKASIIYLLNTIGFKKYLTKKNVQKLIKEAYSNSKSIAMLYSEELQIYRDNNVLLKPVNFLKFGYYPIEYFANQLDINSKLGNNILVGNSSSYTNNHLEIFNKLKNISIEGKKVIVPLSYGDPELKNYIVNKGHSLFKEQFNPILDFMPLVDYNKLIQSCDVVIMNHYRQQAVGNIISAVYIGAKVFLNPENSAYHYLKNLGCHVFEIEKDLNTQEDLIGLTEEQIEQNRTLLKEDINQKKLIDNLIYFLTNQTIK